jgi:uncharacterized protein (DUF2126 family)
MTSLEQLAIKSAIKWLKEEQSVDDPDCGDEHCPDCQATRERVGLITKLEAALAEDIAYRMAIKQKDKQLIINAELKLEIERLKRILDIHSINYQLL